MIWEDCRCSIATPPPGAARNPGRAGLTKAAHIDQAVVLCQPIEDHPRRWCTRQTKSEVGPKPNLLCDDRLATDGIGASDRQHPVQDRHADDSLVLLGSEAAGPQTWSDQRLVPTHCCFY